MKSTAYTSNNSEKGEKMRREKRDNNYKIDLFMSFFTGLKTAYGSYDPKTGKYFVQKHPVTKSVIYQHLKGNHPYGFYLLTDTRTHVGVIDFDDPDIGKVKTVYQFAKDWDFPVYIERSKSKGHHIWMFFEESGAEATKVRIILTWLLNQNDEESTEVFPKQIKIDPRKEFGNFINAPLFGRLVPENKTVFLNPELMKPFEDQWKVLESINRINNRKIDDFISTEITDEEIKIEHNTRSNSKEKFPGRRYPLPTCIRRMLAEGVTFDQRVACFRIAAQLMQIGLPFDHTLAVLREWRARNKPHEGKRIITGEEIHEQAASAYKKNYKSFGCNDPVIKAFCDPECPLLWNRNNKRF